jgi:hypothetical protein
MALQRYLEALDHACTDLEKAFACKNMSVAQEKLSLKQEESLPELNEREQREVDEWRRDNFLNTVRSMCFGRLASQPLEWLQEQAQRLATSLGDLCRDVGFDQYLSKVGKIPELCRIHNVPRMDLIDRALAEFYAGVAERCFQQVIIGVEKDTGYAQTTAESTNHSQCVHDDAQAKLEHCR